MSSAGHYSEDFSPTFQRRILALLCREPNLLLRRRDLVQRGYFENSLHQAIFTALIAYVDKYSQLPSKQALFQITRRSRRRAMIHQEIAEIFNIRVQDSEFVEDQIVYFARKQALKGAILQTVERLGDEYEPDFHEIERQFEDALSVGRTTKEEIYWYFSQTKARIKEWKTVTPSEYAVSTGISAIDKAIDGGLAKKELGVILGPTNTGKSGVLANIAVGGVAAAKNVHVVTLEMAAKKWARRVDQRITGRTKHELRLDPFKRSVKRIAGFAKTHGGSLVITEHPARQLTVGGLRSVVSDISREAAPDLLIVDYADLMRHAGEGDNWQTQGSIYEHLHGLAKELAIPIWTGCQTNREGLNSPIVRLDMIGESWRKAQIADVVIALCQTEDEERQRRLRLFLAKAREDRSRYVLGHFETRWEITQIKPLATVREDDSEFSTHSD